MIENFRYLLLIRLFSLMGIVLVLVYLNFFVTASLPLLPICIIILVMLFITFWSWYDLKKRDSISKKTFFTQLLIDVIALSLLIYFSGGSANPLISLFLIPVIFSAASLPRRYTWSLTAITVVCYTLLMFFQVPLSNHHHHHETVDLHLWGMWYGFILSVLLVAYFVSRISYNLREHEHLLTHAREAAMRDEQIIALGTLAANTAHELGTPLSTMAILTNELEHDYQGKDEKLTKDLVLLRSQIDRCKSAISSMAEDAGEIQADSGIKQSLKDYLDKLIDEWANNLTDIDVRKHFKNKQPSPNIVIDRSLTYAFTNILINSSEASPTLISVEIDWDNENFSLLISDNGHGIDEKILSKIGNNIISGSGIEKGMGIGLFLAKTTINRFGGDVVINSVQNGTTVNITIPLQQLLADKNG